MQLRRRDNPYKTFVKVRADHCPDGSTMPLMFRTEDGPTIRIDKVVDIRTAASLRAGGQGVRYTCRIQGQELYLFNDGEYWFVENEQIKGLVFSDGKG